MTETPATLADVYARYRATAPDPDPSSPDVAAALSRHLLVTAVRALACPGQVSLACTAFAALHAFGWLRQSDPGMAAWKAREVATAWRDGDVGEWLWNYAADLGADPDGLLALAEAEHRLRAAGKAPGSHKGGPRPDGACGETPETAEAALRARLAAVAAVARQAVGETAPVGPLGSVPTPSAVLAARILLAAGETPDPAPACGSAP